MSGIKTKNLEHTFNLEETSMALSYHRFDAETKTDISSFVNQKDNLKPDEKFIYDFRPEWEDIFRKMDDYLIGIGQHFHLKHTGSRDTPLNKFMGLLFKAFSWFVTCKK